MSRTVRTGLFTLKAYAVIKAFSDTGAIDWSLDFGKVDDFNSDSIVIQDHSNEVVLTNFKNVDDDDYDLAVKAAGGYSNVIKNFGTVMLHYVKDECNSQFHASYTKCLDRSLDMSRFIDDDCDPDNKETCSIDVKDLACIALILSDAKTFPKGISSAYVKEMTGIPLDPVLCESVKALNEELKCSDETLDREINDVYTKYNTDCAALREARAAKIDQLKDEHTRHVENIKQTIYEIRSGKKMSDILAILNG